MDSIGIIGGIFEILLSGILIIYTKIRHNLYFHSIINECNKVRQQEMEGMDILKSREFNNQIKDVSSNEESKKINFENRRLLNHQPSLGGNDIKKNGLVQQIENQIAQIKMKSFANQQLSKGTSGQISRRF